MGMNVGMPINTASLTITSQMLSLISEIDEFKGAWRALGTLAPDRLSALRRVATIESIGSSTRIEGSKLSDSDVERLLSNIEVRHFATRDEQEVAGYAEVMETIFASFEAIALTENHIKQLHRDLLAHSCKDARHRGSYKTNINHVSAFDADGKEIGVVFETATPFDTPRLMAELVEWVNETLDGKQLHPLLVTAIFIVAFLEIHPFQDGNGRLSRVLTTLLLLRSWLCLCALLLARKCDRGEQGGLLYRASPDAGDDPQRRADMGAVDHLFPPVAPAAKGAPGGEDCARAVDGRADARALGADSRAGESAWADH